MSVMKGQLTLLFFLPSIHFIAPHALQAVCTLRKIPRLSVILHLYAKKQNNYAGSFPTSTGYLWKRNLASQR